MALKRALPNDRQITPQLAGLSTNMVSMSPGVSASRGQMEGGQAAQTLVLNNPDYPRTYTCVEQEMAKYTFASRARFNCEVIAVIDKFRTGLSRDAFLTNPYSLAIVRDLTRRGNHFDVIEIPTYFSHHNNFGYMGVPQPALKKIRHRPCHLEKGETLYDSPGNGPEGFYRRGLLSKVAFLTSPYVTEDGYWASNEWCERATATGIGEIFITVPKGHYLLPINGTKDNPKFIPSLGEKIRPDGMVLCTREADPILELFQLTDKGSKEVDLTFDEPKYIEGSCRNATVIDIEVYLNEQEFLNTQPCMLDDDGNEIPNQIVQIWNEHKRYYGDIIKVAEEIERECGKTRPAQFENLLCQEIYKAQHVVGYKNAKPIRFMNHSQAIPTATIRIKYKYDIIPEIGSKIAGDFGDKGVLCRKTPASWMPKDKHGFVCDLVVHANATINRMISVRLDDQYLGAQCLLKEKQVKELWEDDKWEEAFEVLAEFYSVATPRAYKDKFLPFMVTKERRYNHVKSVVNGHIMLELKQNDTPNFIDLTEALEDRWPYDKGPVTFLNTHGLPRKSKGDVIIGTSYIRVLEKTGHDWGAVDSPARQAHGIAAKVTHRDRHARPYRKQPYRYGESELRPIVALCGEDWAADIMDRSNNPKASEEIFRNIMEHETPSNMEEVIDRNKVPVGSSVTHQYLRNALYTSGSEFERTDIGKKTGDK